ncbi:hypothetical protein Q765_00420 [Flavobacterium rivuli WB 3.3-2 = DSM 21788]|uniref:AAA+ ATPase domain-containing protein n=1 Tax=Flavobacterium rivuli WB 3.3-2 = DSM 21788 TaxID=1121895 RepID=A0A0A2MAC1_9FLAO|nr:hypothetical protein [Flavobacterium rivuli]KGO88413.1 hypothetical protein Q765_00420 [Flavobacterium rivuli WB 3.3-2 = DSM 21788]
MEINRALSVDQILNKKFIELELPDEWAASLGEPEASGIWIIWGNPANGKSRFSMMLAKCLAQMGRVAYNSLEEGARKSFQNNVKACRMHEVKKNFIVLNREPVEALRERLSKKQAPRFVFIDSLQYTELTKKQYIALKEEFTNVLFIFISHAEGKEPKGALASFIRYDADIKIRVEGYRAFPASRMGGGEPYTIWPEAAAKYWAEIK